MIQLNTNLGTVYFYIKDKVIFNISSSDNGDVCAKKGVSGFPQTNEVRVPYVIVTDRNSPTSHTNYFLTPLINDGDAYSSDTFYKHCDEGTPKNLAQYYEQLCEEEVIKSILNSPSKEFDYWVEHKQYIGIPMWMFSDTNYTVAGGIHQITFNEEYFDNLKNKIVQEQAYKAAEKKANMFGYKVTSEKDELIVAKNEE